MNAPTIEPKIDLWHHDKVQFARLLAEIATEADLSDEQWQRVMAATDLTLPQVTEVVNRAIEETDATKAALASKDYRRFDVPPMDYDLWWDTYKPITNSSDSAVGPGECTADGKERLCGFETSGADLEEVLRYANGEGDKPYQVWTICDGEDGGVLIQNGYHLVNRIAYIITEKPGNPNTQTYEITPAEDKEADINEMVSFIQRVAGDGQHFASLNDAEEEANELLERCAPEAAVQSYQPNPSA